MTVQKTNLPIVTRPDYPLWYGFRLTLLHRVEGDSPHWGEHWCAIEHAFAFSCTYLHISSIQYAWKQTHKHGSINRSYIYIYIYIIYIYICFQGSIYVYMVYIYAYMAYYALVHQLNCIYIHVYTCSTRPQNTSCKPLALQEAAVSIA